MKYLNFVLVLVLFAIVITGSYRIVTQINQLEQTQIDICNEIKDVRLSWPEPSINDSSVHVTVTVGL